MRVAPDDDVYRVNTVWLGPRGLTFPWTARYLAYSVWLVTFLVVLFVEAVTPLNVGIPPVWEITATTLFTYAVMGFVDHERPVRAVAQTFRAEMSAPRGQPGQLFATTSRRVRIKTARRSARRAAGRAAAREAGTHGASADGAGADGAGADGAGADGAGADGAGADGAGAPGAAAR
jgi:hypothetical protein